MEYNKKPVIYCFRNDLRLADNEGLSAASSLGHPIVLCYILDDISPGKWSLGASSRWWLHHSLQALSKDLDKAGVHLILRVGKWESELAKLALEIKACAVYWSRAYEPYFVESENKLKLALDQENIVTRRFKGYLLFEPDQIKTHSGTSFKVFTPFWSNCLKNPKPGPQLYTPKKWNLFYDLPYSAKLEDLNLLPNKSDWKTKIENTWTPGEDGAWNRLDTFLNKDILEYPTNRDFPSRTSTSKLSPHLHFGEISPRQIWHAINYLKSIDSAVNDGAEFFIRELGWREFSYYLLHHWPNLPEESMRPRFNAFPWINNSDHLEQWQNGQTGYPIIDAGMRQLMNTGWMHNRLRMITASLLVKNLRIPWQQGKAWFWDNLVDADLANNSVSWQWVSGSGVDAAPYFRIFNPIVQSEKFDQDGEFIRQWVPELRALPNQFIHAPWLAPANVLSAAGIVLGENYPFPIVDYTETRQQALNAYNSTK